MHKKTFTICVVAAMIMTACSDKKASGSDADKAADSTASAKDSTELAQPAQEAEPIVEEVEEVAFIDQIPSPKALVSNLKAALKEKGFTGSSTEAKGKYSLESGDKSCTVSWEEDASEGWNYFIRVTINGDAEALKQFYNRAKKLERTEIEGGTSVTLRGNMVEIFMFGC